VEKPTHSAKSRKPAFRGEFHSNPPWARIRPGHNTLTKRYVEECHKRFNAGEGEALLDAIDGCARSGMALPPWAAEAFCAHYVSRAQYGAATLDEAFGVKRKGKHLESARRHKWLQKRVAFCALQLRAEEGLTIDTELFERIDTVLGIGTSRKIYYEPATVAWRKLLRNLKISR
jgi:hypothetical protein